MADLSRCIHPVVLAVPFRYRTQKGREQVKTLSRLARQALEICAVKSQVRLGRLIKDDSGTPQPFDGHYWSLTHKPQYVGAVISLQPAGIDIERIKPVSDAMFQRIAGDPEWRLAAGRSKKVFFRYWTAKEAVLKAEGLGMAGLATCRIHRLHGPRHLAVDCRGKRFFIEHFFWDGHMASVVQNRLRSHWTIQQTLPGSWREKTERS